MLHTQEIITLVRRFYIEATKTYDPINRHEAIFWFATAKLLTFQAEFISGK